MQLLDLNAAGPMAGNETQAAWAKRQGSALWLIDPVSGMDWLQTPEASGYLVAGSGGSVAALKAAFLQMQSAGHGLADAAVLASLAVRGRLPRLGLGEALPWVDEGVRFLPFTPADVLYGIVPDLAGLYRALDAGLKLVQLRAKRTLHPDEVTQAVALAAQHGAQLLLNDDWQSVLACGEGHHRPGLHLGQEDLAALPPAAIRQLQAESGRVLLGLSSHCPWELARAAGCGASYIACGPVKPTTTKAMPWQAQGLDNLAWWCRHSPAPVVAIGGLLSPQDVAWAMQAGPDCVCVLRALDGEAAGMAGRVRALRQALARDGGALVAAPAYPHPAILPA